MQVFRAAQMQVYNAQLDLTSFNINTLQTEFPTSSGSIVPSWLGAAGEPLTDSLA
jgi:hypothetical protein